MSLISKEEAMLELESYFPLLRKAVYAAWDSWISGPIAPRMQHKRVRANLVWNDYFFEMIKELSTGEHRGIRFGHDADLLIVMDSQIPTNDFIVHFF